MLILEVATCTLLLYISHLGTHFVVQEALFVWRKGLLTSLHSYAIPLSGLISIGLNFLLALSVCKVWCVFLSVLSHVATYGCHLILSSEFDMVSLMK